MEKKHNAAEFECGRNLFCLEIKDYSREKRAEYGCTWCCTDFSIVSEQWLNYGQKNAEVLTAEEVDDLSEILGQLLSGKLRQPEKIGFIEPDFFLNLYPNQENQSEPSAEWKIYFWDKEKELTANHLSLIFGRREIEALWIYLKIVRGKLSQKDAAAQKLIQKKILL